jgi:hypothetical protein
MHVKYFQTLLQIDIRLYCSSILLVQTSKFMTSTGIDASEQCWVDVPTLLEALNDSSSSWPSLQCLQNRDMAMDMQRGE